MKILNAIALAFALVASSVHAQSTEDYAKQAAATADAAEEALWDTVAGRALNNVFATYNAPTGTKIILTWEQESPALDLTCHLNEFTALAIDSKDRVAAFCWTLDSEASKYVLRDSNDELYRFPADSFVP